MTIRTVDPVHRLAILAALMPVSVAPASPTITASPAITGEVRALESQPIYTPPANGGPVILRYFIPDGTEVSPGEPLLRVDPGQSASRLRTLNGEIAKTEAVAEKEIAELQVKALDAELALVEAEANAGTARIDAALPRELVSALDFDRYKGELERAERELLLKQRELDDARAAALRRSRDSKLELRRMGLEQKFHEVQLEAAEVRAERAGIVLHALDPRTGLRFEEGSTSFAGLLVGEIVSFGNMAVRAYALETDRRHFAQGAQVSIEFDALPESKLAGRIETISGAPEPRAAWGDGRYFTIDILLKDDTRNLRLLPGMSARIRALPAHGVVVERAR